MVLHVAIKNPSYHMVARIFLLLYLWSIVSLILFAEGKTQTTPPWSVNDRLKVTYFASQ